MFRRILIAATLLLSVAIAAPAQAQGRASTHQGCGVIHTVSQWSETIPLLDGSFEVFTESVRKRTSCRTGKVVTMIRTTTTYLPAPAPLGA